MTEKCNQCHCRLFRVDTFLTCQCTEGVAGTGLTFVGVIPFVCCCFMAHVVGQVTLFGPGGNVGGEAEQGVVHGQAIVMCGWTEEGRVFHELLANKVCRERPRRLERRTYPVRGAFCVGWGAGHAAAAVGRRVAARPPVVF